MKKTVLIIEDNPDNMYLMRFLMENSGFIVMGADNGLDGIELALYEKIDLILLDIQLPEMDGYAIARELRSHKELKSLPIVAVTSYAMVGDREKALEAGANGYVEKPIDPDTFVKTVSGFIIARE